MQADLLSDVPLVEQLPFQLEQPVSIPASPSPTDKFGVTDMNPDIAAMEQQLAELTAKLAAAKRETRAKTLDELSFKMREAGVSIDELAAHIGVKVTIPAAIKVTRAAPKVLYRDYANPANEWSGRGRPARWLQAYLDQGHTKEEFLIE
jgi:DNA-binding protein H-NS